MDWGNFLTAGGLGVGTSLLGGHNSDPNKAASKYLDQIPGMEKEYLNPFIERGKGAYDVFNPITSEMARDPAAFLEKMMQSYEPSRGFQLKKDQMLRGAGNTAAAGGMRGSIGDIGNEAHITDMLMGDDMQQWLQNVFGIQGKGLDSQTHLYDTGYDASKNIAGDLSNVFGTQATNAFNAASQKNKSRSDLISGLLNLAGTAGGYMVGGPVGGAVGGQVGKSVGSNFV